MILKKPAPTSLSSLGVFNPFYRHRSASFVSPKSSMVVQLQAILDYRATSLSIIVCHNGPDVAFFIMSSLLKLTSAAIRFSQCASPLSYGIYTDY